MERPDTTKQAIAIYGIMVWAGLHPALVELRLDQLPIRNESQSGKRRRRIHRKIRCLEFAFASPRGQIYNDPAQCQQIMLAF